MSRMLTIVSLAGIMVLILLPLLYAVSLHHLWANGEDDLWVKGDNVKQHLVAFKGLLSTLVALGVTILGALGLIALRLIDRHFRG
jgi:hypothetical protein